MRTKHQMLATIPVGDPDLGAEVEAMLTFTFLRGAPAQGPSYASGGQPADPDEVELVKAEPYCNGKPSPYYGAFADWAQSSLDACAQSWLEGDGFSEALEQAASDDEAAREYAAELRADR